MDVQAVITELGDLFGTGCVVAAIALWCWMKLNRQLAVAIAVCFAGAVAVTTALKLIAVTYGSPVYDTALFAFSEGAPSGHAACVTVAYGCAAGLFAKAWRGPAAMMGVIYCLSIILGVCMTRVTLHMHTIGDVVAGFAVSLVFVQLFRKALKAQFRPTTGSALELLMVMIVSGGAALASGVRLSSDHIL